MRLKTFFISLLLLSGISLIAQDNDILLTIGNEAITLSEFERIYSKNNNENSLNRQTPDEYMELFINFKLKVLEAEALGMDTTQSFIEELETYRAQLAKPYLTDNSVKDELVKEAYERSKEDILASHILIKVDAKAAPEDTTLMYDKAMEIRQRIIDGEPFEKVARATSDDASVKRNGGNLNYFSVFTMIYPFETAAYNTPVGSISMPVRTSFGYHIINVKGRRPARGQVKVAHIFVRLPEGIDEAGKAAAWTKINIAYDSLQSGADFGSIAQSVSEDPNSARNGGEMPWFGTGRMIPEFEDACFAIENIGDYTKPVKTFYGWHIIKLVDKKGIGTFEEMEAELTEKVNRGDRAEAKSDMFVNKLKQEYNYSLNQDALAHIASLIDSSVFEKSWTIPESLDGSMQLFSIGDKIVSLGEFALHILNSQRTTKPYSLYVYVDDAYKSFSNETIIKYEEDMLADKYPEFRYIVEEYHDGILLFDIMDERVWTKAVDDTLGLETFHQAHKNDYMWGPRADAVVINCDSTVDTELVRKQFKKIIKGKLGEEKLNAKFCNNDSIPCIKVSPVLVEEGVNDEVDKLNMQVGIGDNYASEGGTAFVVVRKIRPAEPKLLNEARGQITSDYQNHLEAQWIEMLKEKYPVEVNETLLSKVKK